MNILAGQQGVSITAIILMMLLISVMGQVLVSMVITENSSAPKQMQVTQAQFIAETGIDRALRYLLAREDGSCTTCTCVSINGNPALTDVASGAGSFTVTTVLDTPAAPTTITAGLNNADITSNIAVLGSGGYGPYGRIMIDREMIDCLDLTATPFPNCRRGVDLTQTTSHEGPATVTRVGQNQCRMTSTARVPSTGLPAERVLTAALTLQEGWVLGNAGEGPPQEDLKGVYCVVVSDCWAVGKNGAILHYVGGIWTSVSSPTTEELKGISCLTATHCWAVGKDGTLLEYVGGVWNSVTSPTGEDLNAVSCVSTTDCWAVGKKNAGILHWDNISGAWHNNGDGHGLAASGEELKAIAMVSATSGWAVGKKGIIYHYDGTSWHTNHHADSGTNQGLDGLSCVIDGGGLTHCWTVGKKNAGIIHYDSGSGKDWHNDGDGHGLATTVTDMKSVSMVSSTSGWAVGKNGTIYHYDGASWHTGDAHATSPTTETLDGISCVAANCWAVGINGTLARWDGTAWSLYGGGNTSLFRWNGSGWSDVSGAVPATVNELLSVSMLSYADGWAVGKRSNGNATIIRWDGTTWVSVSPTTALDEDLNAVFAVSSREAWAVGNGAVCPGGNETLLQWTSASNDWACFGGAAGVAEDFEGIFMLDTNNDGVADAGYAVGGNGSILEYTGIWSAAVSGTTEDLNDVYCVTAFDCWAVGTNGLILQYTAGAWATVPTPTGQELMSVACTLPNDCWAVGKRAGGNVTILHYDGSNWLSPVVLPAPPVNQDLESVYAITATDAWAVGGTGTFLHWDGTRWSADTQSAVITTADLNAIAMVAPQKPVTDWREIF